MSYAENVLSLTTYLHATNAEQFPDAYASLRHALFLTDRLLADEPLPPGTGLTTGDVPGIDDLRRVTLQEYGWASDLRRGAAVPAQLFDNLHHKEKASLLRGIVRAGAMADPKLLLGQLGVSNTLDSLVRDALLLHHPLPAGFSGHLRAAFEHHRSPRHWRPLTTLLDLASVHHLPMLDAASVPRLLARWDDQERLFIALARYAASLSVREAVPLLEEMLVSCGAYTFAQRFAVVDALVRLAGEQALPHLETAAPDLTRGPDDQTCTLFQERLDATMAALHEEPSLSDRDGLVVAQFMFQGSIGQAGRGNSGGLGVFLGALGDAMGNVPGIAHVVTLVLLTPSQATTNPPLAIRRTPGHTVLHVPICCRDALTQYQLMIQEEEIKAALSQVLEIHGVHPDVVHLRYADHGSRAAARAAKEAGARIVFTLTADPHRRLTDAFSERGITGLQAKALTFDLHKVYVADQLLSMADALVAMPTSQGTAPLKAYFPQLVLAPKGQRPKPLNAIAEGIQLLADIAPDPDSDAMRALLDETPLGPDTDRTPLRRPVMLSVGRLNPIKQQDLLVEAWARSRLYETYNLVLIGGNPDAPTSVERRMQATIEEVLDAHTDARPYFRLVPAMPNRRIRRLEQAIVLARPAPTPHVYVCPSIKEEFGIAVLEAMDAGLVVVGPMVGGLSSYITHGENGFLMDTGSAATIAEALQTILTGQPPETLATIAEAGARSVRAQFDIHTTAAAFAQVYGTQGGPAPS